jgi:predicted DNA-binding transcriptional regulator AlpA
MTPDKFKSVGKPRELEQHYRFADLQQLRIVNSYDTLTDWVKNRGFPPGKLLTRRARVWTASEVQEWLDRQTEAA